MNEQERQQEEARMGRLLAEQLAGNLPDEKCLSEKDLEELSSGNLPDDRRDRALEHIAGCATCRRAYVITRRFALDDAKEQPRIHNLRNYTIPLALAASLVLAIGLYRMAPKGDVMPLIRGTPGSAPVPSETPRHEAPGQQVAALPKPSPETPANRRTDRVQVLAALIENNVKGVVPDLVVPSPNQVGFATGNQDESKLFHIGFASLSLRAICRSDESDAIRTSAASLHEWLQQLDLSTAEKKQLQEMTEHIVAKPEDSDKCMNLTTNSTFMIAHRYDDMTQYNFGTWLAAVLIMAQDENKASLRIEFGMQEPILAAKRQKPAGVAERVQEMASIVAGHLDAAAYQRLQELGRNIQRRY